MPAATLLPVTDADRSTVQSYISLNRHLPKRQIARRIESAAALPGRTYYGIYSLVRKLYNTPAAQQRTAEPVREAARC